MSQFPNPERNQASNLEVSPQWSTETYSHIGTALYSVSSSCSI